MKKVIYVFMLVLTDLFLFTTCKNPKIDYESFSIIKETIKPEAHKVVISGEYDLIGEVSSMKLNIAQNEQLVNAESCLMNIDNQNYSVTVDNLSSGSLYYYRYVVEFVGGYKLLTETGKFTTLSDKPLVNTLEITLVDASSFLVKCVVEDDFGSAITERGIYWNTEGNPGVNDHKLKHNENELGEYVCKMENIEPNKTYYVRAYAENEEGVGLGEVLCYQPIVSELPVVITAELSDITSTSATCGGTVISEGGSPVSSCGVCWSTEQNPTVENNFTSDGYGLGDFESSLTGLTPNTLYYVRAYATNEFGTNYGDEVSFTAMDVVVTLEVTDIGYVTAIGHGNVINESASEVTERGVCWGLNHNPDVDGSHGHSGEGLGEYSVTISNIVPGTTYYVRAYAKSIAGLSYGNEVSFKTKAYELPTVTTAPVTQIDFTNATAVGGGEVTSDGGDSVTERGIYFGTAPDPATTGTKLVASSEGTGSFTCTMTGLVEGTTYYVCAYATNSTGTAYGRVVSFSTLQIPSFIIDVSASPSSGGTVVGAGIYQQGQSCTVHATPNSGYAFLNWTEGGSQVSTNANYTFTVNGNRALVANFQLQTAEQTFTVNGVSFSLKRVEGGTFRMGAQSTNPGGLNYDSEADDDYESPVHSVTLSTFYMGETEVTQELWWAVMGSNPSHFSGANLPVEKVSWNMIVNEFLPVLNAATGQNFRLPTEAEWEYAARGGNQGHGYKYAGSYMIDTVAWYKDNSSNQTRPVGTKLPNELGLFDMSGNVYEWCSDWFGNYSIGSQTNPQGPLSGSDRVLRGGGWYNESKYCRVSYRKGFDPVKGVNDLGFRLCLPQ